MLLYIRSTSAVKISFRRFAMDLCRKQVTWAHFAGDDKEATLCMLHASALTTYKLTGELQTVALPASVNAVHAIPQGLLLEVTLCSFTGRLIAKSIALTLRHGISDQSIHVSAIVGAAPDTRPILLVMW